MPPVRWSFDTIGLVRRSLYALALSLMLIGCSSDDVGLDLTDASGIPALEAGGGDRPAPVVPDGGKPPSDSGTEAAPPDVVPPMAIVDLSANTAGHTAITLAWTAPSDPPSGKASSYELRYAKTNITSLAEFTAATAATVPAPKAAGSPETFTVNGLEPETTYYFVIRAKDAAGNVGPLSNVAGTATKARAGVLLSEVALTNAAGTDFVELVVTKAGNVKGMEVRQSGTPNVLHTFGDLDVATGDRLVVHLTGLSGPTGFAQEDTTKSKTSSTETTAFASNEAWDVYSAAGGTGLAATDALVSVIDGLAIVDAVAYSARDGDAAATTMSAFANATTANAWTFTAAPVDGANDCATQREAVGVSTSLGNGTCGRFASGIAAGKSINRAGTTDTNGKKDWYVADQSPGIANAAVPGPAVASATATSSTSVEIVFSQEIDAATVVVNAFTGSGVAVTAATLTDVARVTLTTSAQGGPHAIGIGSALKTIYGASVTTTVRFCGYEPLGGMVVLTEVNPTIPGADLVELQATRAGLVGLFSVRESPTAASSGGLVVNFPAGFCVALGDIVVVHMEPAAPPAMPNETTAKDEHPVAMNAGYYDGAWDLRGGGTGLVATDSVIAVRDGAGAYVDAVAITNSDGTSSAAFQTSLAFVQGLGLWTPADCGGAACTDTSIPTAQAVSASRVGVTTDTTTSLRKSSAGAARTATSWSVGLSSWGATN